MAPEGVESNEMVFELITDAEWKNEPMDVGEWLKTYSQNRYGRTDAHLDVVWNEMRRSIMPNMLVIPVLTGCIVLAR